MQTQDDDFPYTSDDPSLTPPDSENAVLSLTSQQLDDLKGTLRLVVGSAMNGKDLYSKRLRQMQTMHETVKPENIVIDANETSRDQLKYLLLGILFETPDLLQKGLVTVEQISGKVFGLFSKILSPFTSSWVFSPVKGQVDGAAARGEKVIDRLVMQGRVEEQNSRLALQQKAVDDIVNELLEYVIVKTDATKIIEEAGIGVAGGVTDEFREQSSNVDAIMEQKLRSIFHKRASPQPDVTTSNPAEKG